MIDHLILTFESFHSCNNQSNVTQKFQAVLQCPRPNEKTTPTIETQMLCLRTHFIFSLFFFVIHMIFETFINYCIFGKIQFCNFHIVF